MFATFIIMVPMRTLYENNTKNCAGSVVNTPKSCADLDFLICLTFNIIVLVGGEVSVVRIYFLSVSLANVSRFIILIQYIVLRMLN